MNASDELWMWLHLKDEMIIIVHQLYLIKTDNFSYLVVTNDVIFNFWKNRCERRSMNVSVFKTFIEYNLLKPPHVMSYIHMFYRI